MALALNNNFGLAALTNMWLDLDTADTYHGSFPLLDKFQYKDIIYGDTVARIFTDKASVIEYSKTSSLLTITDPVEIEESITGISRKVVPLSLNHWLITNAFDGEGSVSKFGGYVLSWLEKSKDLYLKNSVVYPALCNVTLSAANSGSASALAINVPAAPAAGATNAELEAYARVKGQSIARQLHRSIVNLTENESTVYNGYGYTEFYSRNDLICILNEDIVSQITYHDLPTSFHEIGLDTALTGVDYITIPGVNFADANRAFILIHKQKFLWSYVYNGGTQFFDASNLYTNNWRHFSYISGMFKGYPIIVGTVTPAT
jgi:hypothetical protein